MAGYSSTPLIKKLGIKEGDKILTFNTPSNYWQLLENLPQNVENKAPDEQDEVDFIHFFALSEEQIKKEISGLKSRLKKDGMLWISWPKKASKVSTDLNDMAVRNAGLETGLVDVKVCAVDEIWSGLKFVFRKEDR